MQEKKRQKPPTQPPVPKGLTARPGRTGRPRGIRAQTQRRLVEAAIDIIRHQGTDALTTARVANAAGIAQSSFYLYFKDIDECKRAAAEQVAAEVRQFIADHRRQANQTAEADPAAVQNHYQAMLRLFLYERHFSELLLRYRHDASPLGEVLRGLFGQLRQDLIEDLRQLVRHLAPDREDDRRLMIYADVVMGMVVALGEGLLEGRHDDPEALARELTLASFAIARAVLEGDVPR